ncbi:MAG: exodeoxyribonuclease VII large subunit [Prevotella sp.]|nr:exodeoxyribonuclease VII large subunit [Prevotella sp.]
MKNLTLLELNSLVRMTLEQAMPDEYWVEAELSEAREWGGHCYMELIQKDERANTPVAKASAKCWRSTWMLLRPAFERQTGQTFHAGLKVLLKVYAQFHENYGFSWIVTDIDATYTMGDMARKRQEIIRQLKEEGVFDLNKELRIPMFAQRMAVISSANAAGYGDFCNQLTDNEYGFRFRTELFTAVMQGEQVEQTVINALNRINERADEFDCVVIIRGGGATSDLSGFDTLALAENVANFPLPVITGIGHDRDESVLDMVSNTRVKTPTAAAALLIDNLATVFNLLEDAQETIVNIVKRRMTVERMRLERLASHIPVLFSVVRTRQEARLERLFSHLTATCQQQITTRQARLAPLMTRLHGLAERKLLSQHHRIDLLQQRAEAQNPERLLQRGYSITLHNGRAVSNANQLQAGDEITTRLAHGMLRSTVLKENE